MADSKISALTAATTPLAGTEVLPIVQSGVTKKVAISNVTAGRAISATQITLTTGNLIVSNGKGIDFSATPGTGTSELFADYEEGTWTPTITPATGAFTTVTVGACTYTKIGRVVTVSGRFTLTNSGTGAGLMTIAGLPFSMATAYDQQSFIGRAVNSGAVLAGQTSAPTSLTEFSLIAGGSAIVSGFIYTFTVTYAV
jgi:hypothetical protein